MLVPLTCIQTLLLSGKERGGGGRNVSARELLHVTATPGPVRTSLVKFIVITVEVPVIVVFKIPTKFLGFIRNFLKLWEYVSMSDMGLCHGRKICQARLRTTEKLCHIRGLEKLRTPSGLFLYTLVV